MFSLDLLKIFIQNTSLTAQLELTASAAHRLQGVKNRNQEKKLVPGSGVSEEVGWVQLHRPRGKTCPF